MKKIHYITKWKKKNELIDTQYGLITCEDWNAREGQRIGNCAVVYSKGKCCLKRLEVVK